MRLTETGFFRIDYLVCGSLLLLWAAHTLKVRFTKQRACLALAAVAPLTLLVTYHRPYDAKLLLIAVPACALLWAERGLRRWLALLLTTAGIVFTSDIPLIILSIHIKSMKSPAAGLWGKIQTGVLLRPTPLILLLMSLFYLWVYLRGGDTAPEAVMDGDRV